MSHAGPSQFSLSALAAGEASQRSGPSNPPPSGHNHHDHGMKKPRMALYSELSTCIKRFHFDSELTLTKFSILLLDHGHSHDDGHSHQHSHDHGHCTSFFVPTLAFILYLSIKMPSGPLLTDMYIHNWTLFSFFFLFFQFVSPRRP
jgi:hypothetical protein